MRIAIAAGIAAVSASFGASLAAAQGGEFMWCQAKADNGAEATAYYSAFFAAGAWQADAKAKAFKSFVEDEEISASAVTATCAAPADYDTAVAARNAAMKAAPGQVTSWAG